MRKWVDRPSSAKTRPASWRPRRSSLQCEQLESRLAPAVISVTTTADDIIPNDGSVSLREAITAINAGNDLGDPDITAQNPGIFGTNDAIKFNIPGAAPFQINVGSAGLLPLPVITTPMVIDGTSQPGFAGKPIIILNGADLLGPATNPLDIELRADASSARVA